MSHEPVRSISAVTLATADMGASTSWYEALGFVRLYGGPEAAFTSYRVGGSYLNLQLVDGWMPAAVVWGRTILYVDDVDEMHARVLETGRRPEMAPSDAPWGERYFHVRDPDGHELSFAKRLDG